MKLYTRHNPEFDPVKQVSLPFEHSPTLEIGEDFKDFEDNFIKAYKWLFEKIGTDQVIWCYPYKKDSKDYWVRHGQEMKTWILDVPDDKIVARIDDDVWEHMIGNFPYCPDSDKWYEEGEKLFGNDTKAFDKWYDEKEKAYCEKVPKEQQYMACFVDWDYDHDLNPSQILVPSPLKPEWVVDVIHASDYDIDFLEIGCLNHGFTDVRELNKFMEIAESFLNGRGWPWKKSVIATEGRYSVKYEGWEHLVEDD